MTMPTQALRSKLHSLIEQLSIEKLRSLLDFAEFLFGKPASDKAFDEASIEAHRQAFDQVCHIAGYHTDDDIVALVRQVKQEQAHEYFGTANE